MVVADDGEHATQRRGTRSIGMFEHVPRPVDARRLPVPDSEQAIIFCTGEQAELLAAPDSGCAKVFVQAFPEFDVVGVEPFLGRAQLLVVTAKR